MEANSGLVFRLYSHCSASRPFKALRRASRSAAGGAAATAGRSSINSSRNSRTERIRFSSCGRISVVRYEAGAPKVYPREQTFRRTNGALDSKTPRIYTDVNRSGFIRAQSVRIRGHSCGMLGGETSAVVQKPYGTT